MNANISRRSFLARTSAISGLAALQPTLLWGQELSVDENVEKVLVIFKTHLDIGFTDMAATVIKTYFEKFIPNVMSLTEQIDGSTRKTVTSDNRLLADLPLSGGGVAKTGGGWSAQIWRAISCGTVFPSRRIPN